jgi:hypothetical protein
VLSTAAGIVLLVLVALDVFLTVLHLQARGGPLTRRLGRGIWTLFTAAAPKQPGMTRSIVLGLAGPLIIAAGLGVWTLGLVIAFALVYLPHMPQFLVQPGSLRTHWVEAFYFSASVVSTVGTGDMVPGTRALRMITAVEGLTGFAMVTIGISYLFGVYGELAVVYRLGSTISTYFTGGVDATIRRVEAVGVEPFARWSEGVASCLLGVLQADSQYPVLQYFRSGEPARALTAQIGTLLEFRRAVERGGRLPGLASHPSYVALMEALRAYIEEIEKHFVPRRFDPAPPAPGEDPLERAYTRIRRYKRY